MSDYPPRVEKSENIYRLWESGDGDMGELAIGLYDLTAHYKALWDDYAKLEADKARLDFLQEQIKGYGLGWILRASLFGRGMRLHETSQDGAKPTVREAIDDAMGL